MRKHLSLLFSITLLLFPVASTAQSSGSLLLMVDPALPEVGESYTVSSRVQGNNTPKTSQRWFLNGSELTEFENNDTITITARDTQALVSSRVILSNGTQLEASKTISPLRVDLIVSADTRVPAFYKGRSLPSSGSIFSVSALVFRNDVQIQNGLSYLWSIDNKQQSQSAVLGDNTVTYIPNFEREVLVSVEIFDAQNKKIAADTVSVPVVEPEVYFYEHNPLRGLSTVALHDPHIFVGEEMTVRGEGYFLNAESNTADFITEWKIDGKTTSAASKDGKELIIRKEGNSGKALLSFHIRNLKNLLQGVREDVTITF